MNERMVQDPAAAEAIESTAMGLAARAAERMLGTPDGTSAGPDDFRWWQSYLASRLHDLAAAVSLGRPGLFIAQMRWCHDALTAKQVPTEPFHQALAATADEFEASFAESGSMIADTFIRPAVNDLAGYISTPDSALDNTTTTGRLMASYILALLEGERRQAIKLIHDAVDAGLPIQDAYLKILVPAANEIGRMWHQDEVTVGEEHFATATTQLIMAQLLAKHPEPAPLSKTVLAVGVAGDRHGLGLMVVSDFFDMDGWRVVNLGPDVPREDILQGLTYFQPDLLVLSATLQTHLSSLDQMIRNVRALRANDPLPVLVGGYAFRTEPEVAKQIGADGYAEDAVIAVEHGRRLVGLDPASGG